MKRALLSLIIGTAAFAVQAADNPRVVLETSKGDITITLYPDKAPKSVENFLAYVKSGFYDGTIFHRVIPGFMIQGGGFTPDMTQKSTRAPIKNEADNGLSNERGTVAMARTGDPDSATSQFFINQVDNQRLDFVSKDSGRTWGYTVFGKVTDGMDVVDDIAVVDTDTKQGFQNVPVEPVVIEHARVLQ